MMIKYLAVQHKHNLLAPQKKKNTTTQQQTKQTNIMTRLLRKVFRRNKNRKGKYKLGVIGMNSKRERKINNPENIFKHDILHCTSFNVKELSDLIKDFIEQAPVLDRILALAPKHLIEPETEFSALEYLDQSRQSQFLIKHLCQLANIKNKQQEEDDKMEGHPSHKFFKGNAVRFLLNEKFNQKQKINFLQCLPQLSVEALKRLVNDLKKRTFINLCPWSSEHHELQTYSIYNFFSEKEVFPIFFLINYYYHLLDIFSKSEIKDNYLNVVGYSCHINHFTELEKKISQFQYGPFYVFPTPRYLLNYMMLNKMAKAGRDKAEQIIIDKLQSHIQSGDKFIPLSNFC